MTAVGNTGAVVPELNSAQFHDLTPRHATPRQLLRSFLRRSFHDTDDEDVFYGAVLAGAVGMICAIALRRVGRNSNDRYVG
jgi:hypothetical protein